MISKCKLLVLDYGGVYSFAYTSKNFNPQNNILLKAFGRLPSDEERIKIREASHLLGKNKISTAEYIDLLGVILKVNNLPSVEQFEDATIEVTSPPSPEMVALVSDLRKSGTKVSLLSDMYMFEVERTRPWGRYDGFDYVSLSAEVGMTKQDPGVFEKTLDYFQVLAQEALFVDDTLKNIEVAKKVGLHTLYADKDRYKDASSLVQAIYKYIGIK